MVVALVMAELDRLYEQIADRFTRAEPHAGSGLIAHLERKNGWDAGQTAW